MPRADKRFILAMNRFAWEVAPAARKAGERSGGAACCTSTRVRRCKSHGHRSRKRRRGAVAAGDPLRCRPTAPAGIVELVFAGDALDPARRRMHRGAAHRSRRRLGRRVAPGAPTRELPSMAIRLEQSDPDFEARFRRLPRRPSARFRSRSTTPCARSSPRCAPTATRRLLEYTERFDGLDLAATGMPCHARRDRGRLRARPTPKAVEALRFAHDRIARASRKAAPGRRPLRRSDRRRARLALDGDRGGRPLRAGRHGELSELGADERGAGQGRRRRAHRHGRAGAGRRDQPAGAGRRRDGRRDGDLPDRRRAGDRRAGLWHRDDRAGRQDRRAGQCLCRGRQAPGVRHRRHRHDRRPVGSAGHRRRRQRSGLGRRRPAGAGRARCRRRSRS